jgi:hypothetical protein
MGAVSLLGKNERWRSLRIFRFLSILWRSFGIIGVLSVLISRTKVQCPRFIDVHGEIFMILFRYVEPIGQPSEHRAIVVVAAGINVFAQVPS